MFDRGFAISWRVQEEGDGNPGVVARKFGADGSAQGAELVVSDTTIGPDLIAGFFGGSAHRAMTVVQHTDDKLLLAWRSQSDGEKSGATAQILYLNVDLSDFRAAPSAR